MTLLTVFTFYETLRSSLSYLQVSLFQIGYSEVKKPEVEGEEEVDTGERGPGREYKYVKLRHFLSISMFRSRS